MSNETSTEERGGEREYVVELEEGKGRARRVAYTLGALGGVALGAALVRAIRNGLGPGRWRRRRGERAALTELEDRVLDALLQDEVLSQRALEVGALARGMVELTGPVHRHAEVERAMSVVRRVAGVQTVVNRMRVEEDELREPREGAAEWTGLRTGMGRRRQARETEPDRPDDSRRQREVALERADREQFSEEGYHYRPRMAARGEPSSAPPIPGGEMQDTRSPYGTHAAAAPEPRDTGPGRVGEGLNPGTELRLEAEELPVKPHQRPPREPGEE